MPFSAICTNPRCHFQIKLQDYESGRSIPTPRKCPQCREPVTSLCPHCGFILIEELDIENPRCALCGHDVRKAYLESTRCSERAQ